MAKTFKIDKYKGVERKKQPDPIPDPKHRIKGFNEGLSDNVRKDKVSRFLLCNCPNFPNCGH